MIKRCGIRIWPMVLQAVTKEAAFTRRPNATKDRLLEVIEKYNPILIGTELGTAYVKENVKIYLA